jgi:UDP-N-acetylmuramyl pentapeptide synthase
MMQQNSYRNRRYLNWFKREYVCFDRIFNLGLSTFIFFFFYSDIALTAVSAILILKIITQLRRKYKKPLVFTPRAIRLYTTSGIIVLAFFVILFLWNWLSPNYRFFFSNLLPAVLADCIRGIGLLPTFSFLIIMLANSINAPLENRINKNYYNDAKRILNQMQNLTVIGITGSYGKTSTKHYLYRMLSEKYNVLMTPGSFNTTLGVVRTVREQMKSYHNVFIVEMGAKQPGDIKEICELVRPEIGIITAVGEQHLESFKSIENVQQTKFELIDALPSNGLAVLNYDYEYIANRPVHNVPIVSYSMKDIPVDYHIGQIDYHINESRFEIKDKDGNVELFSTKLIGSYNFSNLLAGYIVSKHLGLTADPLRIAISRIEQVEHRLNIKHTPAGIIIIDDAYNSNPYGAQMALDVIKHFSSGQRIAVTPGFIEMGEKQYEANYELGKQMAGACDYVIIVNEYNREAIHKGLSDASFPQENIYPAPSFAEASAHLQQMAKKGDVILYENDLPDSFK